MKVPYGQLAKMSIEFLNRSPIKGAESEAMTHVKAFMGQLSQGHLIVIDPSESEGDADKVAYCGEDERLDDVADRMFSQATDG